MTTGHIQLEIPSAVAMLKIVDAACEVFGKLAGLDEDALHWFGVSVREASANAMRHGNRNDHGKPVHVSFEIVPDPAPRVVVRVRDQGVGFQPELVADPCAPQNLEAAGGRGFFLMRTFMDDVEVRCLPGGGTEIVLSKRIGQNVPEVER